MTVVHKFSFRLEKRKSSSSFNAGASVWDIEHIRGRPAGMHGGSFFLCGLFNGNVARIRVRSRGAIVIDSKTPPSNPVRVEALAHRGDGVCFAGYRLSGVNSAINHWKHKSARNQGGGMGFSNVDWSGSTFCGKDWWLSAIQNVVPTVQRVLWRRGKNIRTQLALVNRSPTFPLATATNFNRGLTFNGGFFYLLTVEGGTPLLQSMHFVRTGRAFAQTKSVDLGATYGMSTDVYGLTHDRSNLFFVEN